jgi:hypothetical protein
LTNKFLFAEQLIVNWKVTEKSKIDSSRRLEKFYLNIRWVNMRENWTRIGGSGNFGIRFETDDAKIACVF